MKVFAGICAAVFFVRFMLLVVLGETGKPLFIAGGIAQLLILLYLVACAVSDTDKP